MPIFGRFCIIIYKECRFNLLWKRKFVHHSMPKIGKQYSYSLFTYVLFLNQLILICDVGKDFWLAFDNNLTSASVHVRKLSYLIQNNVFSFSCDLMQYTSAISVDKRGVKKLRMLDSVSSFTLLPSSLINWKQNNRKPTSFLNDCRVLRINDKNR